jgi:O-antigen ligase
MNIRLQHIKFIGPLALAMVALPFSIPICHFALIVFGIVLAIDGQWKEKWKAIRTNPIVGIFLFFFLLHLIGIIYSEDKHNAWFAVEKKLSLFVLPILFATVKLEKEEVRKLLHVFVVACLVATFICLGAALRKASLTSPTVNFDSYSDASFYSFNPKASSLWMFISYIELASGIGIHPAYLSLYLTFCVLLLIHFYADSFATFPLTKKMGILALLFYLSVFVLFLSTRITIIALLIISLYGLRQFLKTSPRFILRTSFLAFIFLFCGLVYFNPVSRFRGYQEIISTWPYLQPGLQKQSTTIRASLWSLGIQSLPKINWLLGTGTGDVEQLISETSASTNITNILGTNDPHNQYLQTLLGLGIVGLSTLLACFAWPAWVAYRNGNFLYVGFVFLFSLLCLTETAMELQKGIVFYTLFGSLILFHYKSIPVVSFNPVKV